MWTEAEKLDAMRVCEVLANVMETFASKLRDEDLGPWLLLSQEEPFKQLSSHIKSILDVAAWYSENPGDRPKLEQPEEWPTEFGQ